MTDELAHELLIFDKPDGPELGPDWKRVEGPQLMARIQIADKWIMQVAHALGFDPTECSRVVIDARVGNAVQIYVEKFASEGSIDVAAPDLVGAEITVIP